MISSRRDGKNTQNCTKKILMHQITVMVCSVMQSQIFCNVKSVGPLGSTVVNKASECDGIPVQLFKTLRMMLSKYCPKYVSKSGRPSSGHRTGRGQFSFQPQRRTRTKNVQTSM